MINPFWCLVWAALGIVLSLLSFSLIKGSIGGLEMDSSEGARGLTRLILTRVLRFFLIGAALFFAVRMHIGYALCFLGPLTLTRLIQVIRFNHQQNQQAAQQVSQTGPAAGSPEEGSTGGKHEHG